VTTDPFDERLGISKLATTSFEFPGKEPPIRRPTSQQQLHVARPVLHEASAGDVNLRRLTESFTRYELGGDLGRDPDRDLSNAAETTNLSSQTARLSRQLREIVPIYGDAERTSLATEP
jgi:hypothetical protein